MDDKRPGHRLRFDFIHFHKSVEGNIQTILFHMCALLNFILFKNAQYFVPRRAKSLRFKITTFPKNNTVSITKATASLKKYNFTY